MKPHHLDQVNALNVAEEQLKYVGTLEEMLMNVSDVFHPQVVTAHDEIIGFFLLDAEYSKKYDFAQLSLLACEDF